jgi:drug/metabolite transporter (DMT)-like permease
MPPPQVFAQPQGMAPPQVFAQPQGTATQASTAVQPLPTEKTLGKDRSPGQVLGFSIITLGIYFLVWYYMINNEIRRHDPDIKVTPILSVIAISIGWVVVFPPFISAYSTAARIRQMQLDEQATQTISPGVALVWYILFGIGYPLYLASQLREHWHAHRKAMRAS